MEYILHDAIFSHTPKSAFFENPIKVLSIIETIQYTKKAKGLGTWKRISHLGIDRPNLLTPSLLADADLKKDRT